MTAGGPRIVVTVKNEGRQAVVGFKWLLTVTTRTAILSTRLRRIMGVSQDKIDAGQEDECGWDLKETAATYKVSVEQVRTEDGKEWKPRPGFERSVRTK